MSFECDECHVIATGKKGSEIHFSGSYGQCETCKRVASCSECRCSGAWENARRAALNDLLTEANNDTRR